MCETMIACLPDFTSVEVEKVQINPPAIREDDFSCMFADKDHYGPCCNETYRLPKDSVLGRLRRVQRLGDLEFKKLYEAYDALADRMRNETFSYERLRWTHDQMSPDLCFSDPQVDMVQKYRISSTARDCSIMITFQRLSDGYV